jgi:hypothetical protein
LLAAAAQQEAMTIECKLERKEMKVIYLLVARKKSLKMRERCQSIRGNFPFKANQYLLVCFQNSRV